MIEVIAFAGTLPDASEDRKAGVLLGDVVDQFHHVDGLADAGTTEQANLAALGKGANQVDHLDARFKQVDRRGKGLETRRRLVNRAALFRCYRTRLIDWTTQHVHNAPDRGVANRHGDRRTGVVDLHAATQAVGGSHGDRPDDAVPELLLYLERQVGFATAVLL